MRLLRTGVRTDLAPSALREVREARRAASQREDALRNEEEYPMISAWWTLCAFIGGGCAGVLVIALMRIAADPERSVECCPIRSDDA